MTARRRRFTAEFKKRVALDALRGDVTVQALAAKHEVHPNQVSLWKRQAVEGLAEVFSAGRKADADEALVKELHAKIGELTMERIFSARVGALSRAERLAMVERGGGLSLARQCALLGSAGRRCTGRRRARAGPAWR